MPLELRTPTIEEAGELGRICYEAFKDISDRHGFPTDFPTVEFATQVIGLLMQQEDVYRVAASDDGHLKGSNFLLKWAGAAGVGQSASTAARRGGGSDGG